MNRYIDLHVHSTASDGTLSPAELVQEAKKAGLAAIAVTDHDSVGGIREALDAGNVYGLEVVPGIELSTEYADTEIHVVGLFIDPDNHLLNEQIRAFVDNRDNRNLKIIEKLQAAGFSITAEEIYRRNPGSVIARPHIARYLVDTGQVNKYIGDGCPCFVDRFKITPMRAVELIHAAGGTAVLAHPCLYKMSRETLIRMIEEMLIPGLDGIEAVYSCNQGSDEKDYREIAEKYGLLLSGGSDFHGANKPHIHLGTGRGNLHVPYEFLEQIRESRR